MATDVHAYTAFDSRLTARRKNCSVPFRGQDLSAFEDQEITLERYSSVGSQNQLTAHSYTAVKSAATEMASTTLIMKRIICTYTKYRNIRKKLFGFR